jgi:hypothetical protein
MDSRNPVRLVDIGSLREILMVPCFKKEDRHTAATWISQAAADMQTTKFADDCQGGQGCYPVRDVRGQHHQTLSAFKSIQKYSSMPLIGAGKWHSAVCPRAPMA